MAIPSPHPRTLTKKREILAAASRVFRRRGVHAAGMREIAAELGMTVGSLYYYFENKEDLLSFCQQDGLAGLLALATELAKSGRPPAEQLFALIVGHVERLNEATPGALAHLEVEGLEGERREGMLERRGEYEQALRRLIASGIADGSFRPVDPKVAALTVLGALNWTVKWYRPEGSQSARAIGEQFAEILVRGLLAPGVELATAAAPNLAAG